MTRRRPKINVAVALHAGQLRLADAQRLLSRIEEQEAPKIKGVVGPCWIWQGKPDPKGYGQVRFKGKARWVHRLMYAVFRNGIPDGMQIDHRCRNPSCCNPWHLRRTSQGENCADANRRRAKYERGEPAPF